VNADRSGPGLPSLGIGSPLPSRLEGLVTLWMTVRPPAAGGGSKACLCCVPPIHSPTSATSPPPLVLTSSSWPPTAGPGSRPVLCPCRSWVWGGCPSLGLSSMPTGH
jgi:hypothetical protein